MHSKQILNRVFPAKRDGEDSGEALLGPAKNSLTHPPPQLERFPHCRLNPHQIFIPSPRKVNSTPPPTK